MTEPSKTNPSEENLKCPDCRYPLKRRRSRQVDECEMICGGCGQSFDVCDLKTVDKLKDQS
jgi:hypothetical protein